MGYKLNVPNFLLKNPDLSNLKKPYTQADIDFLHENACKISISELAYHLKRSKCSIHKKINQIGIFLTATFQGHNYIFEKDFIQEIENISGMTKWIYYNLRDEKIIPVIKLKEGFNYLSLDVYEHWLNFFKTHTVSSYFINNMILKKNKRWKQSLLESGNIKRVVFNSRTLNKYWIYNEDIKRVENIVSTHILLDDLSKKVGFTRNGILNIIRRKYLQLDCFKWNGRWYFTESDYKKIKQYANRCLIPKK
jgi:hypothetical protein